VKQETISLGIIGAGNISQTHAHAARALDVPVGAVFGTNPERVADVAREFGATPYSDFERFLAHRPMSMVAIGSPSALHAEQGIAAAQHGLHVLTEKPIDVTVARADALIAAAGKAGVKLGVFFQDRFKPDLNRAREFLASGGLGRIHLVDARVKWFRPPEYYSGSKWRGRRALDGGGALMNQGVHTVDLILWLLGDIASVQAQSRTALHKIEVEDTLTALLQFRSGAQGVLQAATSVYPGYPRRVEISGENGTLVIENDRVNAAHLRPGSPSFDIHSEPADANPSTTSPVVSDIRGHKAALEDFLEAIRDNRPPRCDGHEGRRSVAVVEAIYAAAKSGAVERVATAAAVSR
jgi:UDP-N-acetyl-2-amino-2-deoxyglucuronate dehydrogenase